MHVERQASTASSRFPPERFGKIGDARRGRGERKSKCPRSSTLHTESPPKAPWRPCLRATVDPGRQVVELQMEPPLDSFEARTVSDRSTGFARSASTNRRAVWRAAFCRPALQDRDIGIMFDQSCSARRREGYDAEGRRGENFKPVENENSSRHSGGRHWNSPAMRWAGQTVPVTARHVESRAICISEAMFSGPDRWPIAPGRPGPRRRAAINAIARKPRKANREVPHALCGRRMDERERVVAEPGQNFLRRQQALRIGDLRSVAIAQPAGTVREMQYNPLGSG